MTPLNNGQPVRKKVKPFNFVMIGNSNEPRKHTLEAVKPLIPFTRDHYMAPYRDFVDYHTGEIMNGIEYWKPLDDVFRDYYSHQESKFEGVFGVLDRKHIHVRGIIHIGKESNKLDETNILGVDQEGYAFYDNGRDIIEKYGKEFLLDIGPKKAKEIGLTRGKLYTLKNNVILHYL